MFVIENAKYYVGNMIREYKNNEIVIFLCCDFSKCKSIKLVRYKKIYFIYCKINKIINDAIYWGCSDLDTEYNSYLDIIEGAKYINNITIDNPNETIVYRNCTFPDDCKYGGNQIMILEGCKINIYKIKKYDNSPLVIIHKNNNIIIFKKD